MGLYNQPGTTLAISTTEPNADPEGQLWYDSANDILKASDGTSFNQVGKTSFSSAAIVTHSTTIGDYSTPSAAVVSSSGAVQTEFTENYTDTTGFTAIGTGVLVDDVSFPNVLKFNATPANADHRQHKALGLTLSDSSWSLDFDLNFQAVAGDAVFNVLALTAGTGDPSTASQDSLGIALYGGSGWYMRYKDGAGSATLSTLLTAATAQQEYLTLARTSTTNLRLSFFTNATRTTHRASSPYDFTIPSSVGSLTTLQHGGNPGDLVSKTVTLEIDNLVLTQAPTSAKLIDGSTSTYWDSSSGANPNAYFDCGGSSTNLLGCAIYLHSNTTETEIAIRASSDTTFTSGENTRTITVSNLTAGAWNYIRWNLVNKRYLQVYGNSGTSKVLAMYEFKYLTKTDSQVLQDLGILEISETDTSLALDGT